MCDTVELLLPVWLENSFSVKSQKRGPCSGLSGETIVCEYDKFYSKVHAYWHPWVTVSGVGFSTGTIIQIGKICWNVHLSCLCPENKRLRNMNFSTRCLWEKKCVQRVHIISEPPQCQLFRNQEKQLIFSLTALHFSCYPKGFEMVSYGQTIFSAPGTINKTPHLSKVNMKIIKTWRWWDFCTIFDKWSNFFQQ